jgi:hypothetical protein
MHGLVLAVALVACSQPTQTGPAAPAPASTPSEFAPQLFTVEQLRAGNLPGRVIELRVEAEGKPTTIEQMSFTAATADEVTIRSVSKDESGKVLADETVAARWTELHKHGQFPAAATTFEDNVEITVPAGTFKTRLYTVTAGDATRRFWFAADLPGPPVQFTTEQAGKVVLRAQMLRAR